MPELKPDHYTGVLEIKKVFGQEPANSTRETQARASQLGKRVDEVTRVVVRDIDLEKLKKKLKGHIDLVDED